MSAKLEKPPEGTGVLALATNLIQAHEFEQTAITGEATNGVRGMRGPARRFRGRLLPADLVGDARGFHAPEPELTPAADGHALEQSGFDAGEGLKLGLELGEESVETLGGFAFNEDGLREDAVAEGVAGGDELTFGSYGTTGFCAVETGGLTAFFGVHAA